MAVAIYGMLLLVVIIMAILFRGDLVETEMCVLDAKVRRRLLRPLSGKDRGCVIRH